MHELVEFEGQGDLARFRRLVNITASATFALIIIGGVVRVSDSGLGCGPADSGTHGWPLCEGRGIPILEGATLIEFSHRIVAATVGILILVMAVFAWRRLRGDRVLVRGSIAAGVLVLAQAGLGGLTVENNLDELLVAAHLGLAMILLGTLIGLSYGARVGQQAEQRPPRSPRLDASRGLRVVAPVSALLILATIVAGGYVAGTESEGTASEPALGAHMACGEQFPGCNGSFMPFGVDRLIDIQLIHRLLMYLSAISILLLFVLARRQDVRHWVFPAALAALAGQITLGAFNVWFGEHAGLVLAHLALGTILWSIVAYGAILLVRPPRSGPVAHPKTAVQGKPSRRTERSV